jgi:methyl-accepting chemotaxis protein
MQLWKNLKIRQQIMTGSVVIVVVCVASLVAISIASIKTNGVNALREKGASLAIITSETVKPSVQYDVGEETEKVLIQLLAGDKDVSVAAVVVKNAKGEYTVTNQKTSKTYETVNLTQPLKQLGAHPPDQKGVTVILDTNELQFLASKIDLTANDAIQGGYMLLGLNTSRISNELRNITMIMTIMGFLMGIAGVASAYFIALNITRPLGGEPNYAANIVREISQGNLTIRVMAAEDDKTSLLAAIKAMAENLRAMVGNIRDTSSQVAKAAAQIAAGAGHLSQSAHRQASAAVETSSTMVQMAASIQTVAANTDSLASNADKISTSIQELGASSEQVAQNAEVMASSVSDTSVTIRQMTTSIKHVGSSVDCLMEAASTTASSVMEMDSSIKQVERNAQDTAVISEGVKKDAETGKKAVEATIAGINEIKRSSHITSEVIETLSARADDIGNILSVIDDVAGRTNLLALNAAIIAARAGDHGKGFAVVADEIKKLAERTRSSTKEISKVIGGVQDETRRAVHAINLAEKSIADGEMLSRRSGEALNKIVTGAHMATVQVGSIAMAAVEQARGSKMIREAIERVSEMVSQISEAVTEQGQGSGLIMSAVESMNEVTRQVTLATQEQALSARQIAAAVRQMNGMTVQVASATGEQKKDGEMVVKAIENISDLAHENLTFVNELSQSAEGLSSQAIKLEEMVARFKV